MMGFEICESKKEDLGRILELLKELAVHENMLEDVKCTIKDLEESFFKNNYAKALSLKVDGEIIGYVMYYYTFSSFVGLGGMYLEDIYIQEKYRRNGYAKEVFKYLARICKEKNLKRLEWVCLNDNDLGIKFYSAINAKHMSQWRTYRLDGENLEALF
ncbi:GNAT family N-acetyltransferase [Campylobacter insulaenigrae]|nr:GNAT family N-acetyltransferase [Campylobacter insulaenigrae]MCR6570820.1 GNAT family N-acetyltransferase [Campylobacter insulaenigrae]MCR6572523.1 GNAT family N-acetyltransferase [Campylobacter insulaenigrae]MCR6576895.1 GNAT family N-acetyltransferase [Campylobacter insulaenigrae]MCR6578430.1 GNAT family N-acetyltransferase [Campylobacter insulaenigrae]MCR6581399.1 GNAT family N-acetyltransferase [Campylobacter insulaenigrae]